VLTPPQKCSGGSSLFDSEGLHGGDLTLNCSRSRSESGVYSCRVSGTTAPPSINIQGASPATINAGDTYTDLGAIVTDNQGHNLGYKTFLNGALVSNIVVDTSEVATDTIDYVATDTWGNTATSTRTVIIEVSPSTVPTIASTTQATSTSQ
jgi:hypothetical protein